MKPKTIFNIGVTIMMIWIIICLLLLTGVATGQIDPNSQDAVSNMVRITVKTILRV